MESSSSALRFRLGPLLLWCIAVYLTVIEFRSLLLSESFADSLGRFSGWYSVSLQLTTILAFSSYAVGGYILLYFFYPRVKRRWWLLVPAFALLILSCMFFRAFLEEGILFGLFGRHNYNPKMSWGRYLTDNFYYAIVFTPVGIVYYLSELNRFNEKARQRAALLQRATELKFLRSQVNPHFLFNTLNNLYSLVATGSEKALPALDKLSGLLRYSLYDQTPLVPLTREVSYLEDFLHLEYLRVEDPVPPQVNIGPFTRQWQLPPLLLVPFVENAFKHGELKDPAHPLRISLTEENDRLCFRVSNLKRRNVTSQDAVGGIGLVNTRKRLALVFPGRHELEIKDEEEMFMVALVVEADGGGKPAES